MNSITSEDSFPNILPTQKPKKSPLDEIGDASVVILQFLTMRDLYSIVVANNVLWEQQYITFTGSKLYEHITTEQRNQVEKILNNNEFCKYKRALDYLYKCARENALNVKKQRKEFIESASIRAPKHVYGIPKTFQTIVKERPRLVVVGDHAVGKTSLLNTYPGEYMPCVPDVMFIKYEIEHKTVYVDLNGKKLIHSNMIDTPGQEEYDRLRVLMYPETDVFMVSFSISDPVSFENVVNKWLPEVRSHCPNVPIVLVGTKIDLRDDQDMIKKLRDKGTVMITREEGEFMAKKMGCMGYVEVSAKNDVGVKDAFSAAAKCIGVDINAVPQKKECICS